MKTVIEMAREADLIDDTSASDWYVYQLERFAALVRADDRNRTWTQEHRTEYERSIVESEREACAKVCDDLYRVWTLTDDDDITPPDALDCKRAIRARSNT